MRTPVNSFEFHSCERTPQVANLTLSLGRIQYIAYIELASFTAWTTRVSNPVRSPRFRASVSGLSQRVAFATDVPPDIYEFHLYTGNSATLSITQDKQFRMQFLG